MTDSPKTRLARRLYEAGNACCVPWEDLNPAVQATWLIKLEAVLVALREPTDAMVEAMQTEVDIWPEDKPRPAPNFVQFLSRCETEAIWQAGIDALLSP